MNEAAVELLARGIHAQRRAALWWTLGIIAMTLVTVAFWPSVEGNDAFAELEESSPELLEAFGAQNISTPAGYLDGQLYALMLPLLLSGVAIAGVTAITSGDEDAGRLELIHAMPIARQTIWAWRFCSSLLVLAALTLGVAAVVIATRDLFSLEEVDVGRIVTATTACGLLAAFHAALAYAAGGLGGSRGEALGVSILVLVAGYVVNFLFPLVDRLAGLRQVSPWHWAIDEQPISNGVSAPWLALLVTITAAIALVGTLAVGRRDIRGA